MDEGNVKLRDLKPFPVANGEGTNDSVNDLPPRIQIEDRPLITFALLAYNQERFVREAVEGAFSQNYTPLEIILSDDCSNDRTFQIMKEMAEAYRGPHKIILNRNDRNLGISAHINLIMELSKGEIIVAAAGDDVSLSERVNEIYKAYEIWGKSAMSIHSGLVMFDEKGREKLIIQDLPDVYWMDIEMAVKKSAGVWGCTHAWNRKLFETFGPLMENLVLEDVAISFRSILIGKIVYIRKPLVRYRIHANNLYGHISSCINSYRRFETPEDFYRFRKIRMRDSLILHMQYLEDLRKNNDVFNGIKKDKVVKYIRKKIDDMQLELELMKGVKKAGIIDTLLKSDLSLTNKARKLLLYYFPILFWRIHSFKQKLMRFLK